MKTIPILFSTEMVQALLDGRKTQTRRVMKPQPEKKGSFYTFGGAGWSEESGVTPVPGHSLANACPYGQPGDVLWVRETFYHVSEQMSVGDSGDEFITGRRNIFHYAADGFPVVKGKNEWPGFPVGSHNDGKFTPYEGKAYWEKRPSIFMPKAAARIFLRVVSVRVERLQDISEADAVAEGVRFFTEELFDGKTQIWFHDYDYQPNVCDTAKYSFETLWESINGFQSWDANPWVWVVAFERCERPENFL